MVATSKTMNAISAVALKQLCIRKTGDKSYEVCHARLRERHPRMHDREPYRRGYERGRAYLEAIKARRS